MSGIREEFEKEYDWPSLDDRQRLIVDGSCWSVWQKAWQASRAALRVELPDNSARAGSDPYQDGYYACREDAEEALKQAGIEVAK